MTNQERIKALQELIKMAEALIKLYEQDEEDEREAA